MTYLFIGFMLWVFANSMGANLGPEHILTLPAMLVFVFFILMLM